MKRFICLLCAAIMFMTASTACAANFYLIEDSDTRLLTKEELWQWEYDALSYVLNEIFARHGFHFGDGKFGDYFNNQDWYEPNQVYRTNDEVYELLSGVEWDNEHLVKEVRQEMRDWGTTNPNGRTIPSPELIEMGGEMIAFKLIDLKGNYTIPVYSGPGTEYYRGANGRAMVSTNDTIYAAGWNDGWLLVRYPVDSNALRIGYIPANAVQNPVNVSSLNFSAQRAEMNRTCALTDDPSNTQRRIVRMDAGLAVTVLGTYAADDEWAYVEAVIDNTPVRGFVPLNSVKLIEGGYEWNVEGVG